MTGMAIRDAREGDLGAILALNASEARHTGPMDADHLRHLAGLASCHRVIDVDGTVAAFLLAIRNGATYANPNYGWFAARWPSFLYVDRVVVGAAHQGTGLGRALYDDVFAHARSLGIDVIACEYNLVPPNDPSRLFHERFGFREVGSQWLNDGTKRVSMQIARAGHR
jgi:predicted GNAT superfamily acetyltransferase